MVPPVDKSLQKDKIAQLEQKNDELKLHANEAESIPREDIKTSKAKKQKTIDSITQDLQLFDLLLDIPYPVSGLIRSKEVYEFIETIKKQLSTGCDVVTTDNLVIQFSGFRPCSDHTPARFLKTQKNKYKRQIRIILQLHRSRCL